MFNTLVVPLDGSELAERALPYAIRFAKERGGRMVLVRAAIAPPPSGLDWERQQLEAMGEASAYLSSVAERVATRVSVTTAPLYGHAPDQILAAVEQFDADSIVIGYAWSDWPRAPAAWQCGRGGSDTQPGASVRRLCPAG